MPEVVGLGTDVCEIARMTEALARHGDRFADRILGPQEQVLFRARRGGAPARGAAFLATRFAAKEALAQALGTGMRPPMAFQACELLPNDAGQPTWQWHGALADMMRTRRLHAWVSVSDERTVAVATVLLQQED
ncbi:MAG: holo-ACP synthase [Inhella sp.]